MKRSYTQFASHNRGIASPFGGRHPESRDPTRLAGNYQSWQKQGYPVGNGLVERAVAIVINAHMKKRGMRWKRTNATAVAALRVQRFNDDWELASAKRRRVA